MSATGPVLVSFAVGLIALGAAGAWAAQPPAITFPLDSADGALPAGWQADSDRWRVADGKLRVDSRDGDSYVLFGDESWQNYEIEVTATFEAVRDDSRWVAVVFRASRPGVAPWSQCPIRFRAQERGGAEFAIRTESGSWSVRQAVALKEDCRLGQARKLRVVVRGTCVKAFVDGQPVIDSAYCLERDTGRVGLGASGCTARFEEIRVRLLPPSPKYGEKALKACEVVGHRGFSGVAPENTLAAIDRAIRAGATGSEFDVYACKDGAIVLMHDATVERTTNGRGKVTELTLAELRRLDAGSWKDAAFAQERVPTLGEALARLKGSGCTAVIEIKMEGISQQVADAVRAAGMIDEAAVIAFSEKVVKEVRQIEPRLPCAWLTDKVPRGAPAQRAERLAAQARAYGTDMIDAHFGMLSEEVIAELHKRGITVWTWTVDDPPVMEALMRWGVDSITTDYPDRVVQYLKQVEKAPTGR